MSKKPEYLLLKWGSVVQWDLDTDGEAFKILQRYFKEPVSLSSALQSNTPAQKQVLCDAIDALDGKIQSDWDGRFLSKEQAKIYIMEYNTD